MRLKGVRKIIFLGLGGTWLISVSSVAAYGSSEEPMPIQEEQMEKRPVYLYKILSMEDWAKSRNEVHLSDMDADFIHLSTEKQLEGIIAKYWSDVSEYIILKVETKKLLGELVLEKKPGGTNQYYHLYNGSIPLSSVVEATHKRR